eukprot:CAMPEP_0117075674 /NCGR_PEP_ID=MMETSP0472-20121206/53352_1 /TAXON_ID=693140 ORGANISM="Tiarina fusus, Strain LIS" /NCGR_SAMPLE_ID=MMETSP0472 /ASSEMBLY_ACC=CAM_ASM_000603 /LENGTH=99 /DNA_ID=CAMNT_0004801275 /DNA_START=60 /DNA_END=356 /DNA_ORIENTATION=+
MGAVQQKVSEDLTTVKPAEDITLATAESVQPVTAKKDDGWGAVHLETVTKIDEAPTEAPTKAPTQPPTQPATEAPTHAPTEQPTAAPTEAPTQPATEAP